MTIIPIKEEDGRLFENYRDRMFCAISGNFWQLIFEKQTKHEIEQLKQQILQDHEIVNRLNESIQFYQKNIQCTLKNGSPLISDARFIIEEKILLLELQKIMDGK